MVIGIFVFLLIMQKLCNIKIYPIINVRYFIQNSERVLQLWEQTNNIDSLMKMNNMWGLNDPRMRYTTPVGGKKLEF